MVEHFIHGAFVIAQALGLANLFEHFFTVFKQTMQVKPQFFHLEQHRYLARQRLTVRGVQFVVETAQTGLVQYTLAPNLVAKIGVCNPAAPQHDALDGREGLAESLVIGDGEQVAVITNRMAADRERRRKGV